MAVPCCMVLNGVEPLRPLGGGDHVNHLVVPVIPDIHLENQGILIRYTRYTRCASETKKKFNTLKFVIAVDLYNFSYFL